MEQYSTVDEWVNADGDWNFRCMEDVIPDPVISKIRAMLPPQSSDGEDRITWRLIGDGNFLVRSAYYLCQNIMGSNDNISWDLIWNS